MKPPTANAVRDLILRRMDEQLAARGLTPSDVPPTFDLLLEGLIDSIGVVEIVLMLEQRFAIEFDFDELQRTISRRSGRSPRMSSGRVRNREKEPRRRAEPAAAGDSPSTPQVEIRRESGCTDFAASRSGRARGSVSTR